nr:hypothetical protein [Candidatus Sigynarchaeum springense]
MAGIGQIAEMGQKFVDAIINYYEQETRKEHEASMMMEVLRVLNEDEVDFKEMLTNGVIKKYMSEFVDVYANGATFRRFAKAFDELGKLDALGLVSNKRLREKRQERRNALLAAIDKGDREFYENGVALSSKKFEKIRAELSKGLIALYDFLKQYPLDDGCVPGIAKKKITFAGEIARIIQYDDFEFFELVMRRYGDLEKASKSP